MPGTSPKSPGEVHMPTSLPFREKVMSEGQTLLIPGASEEISAEIMIWVIFVPVGMKFGMSYST